LVWFVKRYYALDYTNQRRAAGETIRTALIQTNHARLRPILMTTILWCLVCSIALLGWCRMEKRIGMGNWWFDKLLFPLIIVPVIYEIMEN
jgi:HAE1 family hydrophobic/amphiphilic exporter-1